MAKVNITETILRDAHQSLIATRMRTEDMLPICGKLDQVGFWSLEAWGGATFDTCLRFLKEDPWERLRTLRRALPNTPLQMLLRGQNLLGYRHYADDVVREFVKKSAENGIDVFRIFDAINDLRNVRVAVAAAKETGKHVQGAICYTVSPVHTIDKFVAQGRELAAMGCDTIVIKDMAGLLTPYAAAALFKALRAAVEMPLHLHTHATAGMAEMCHLMAIENGCTQIDCALSAFGGGTSHSPTESMVAALKGTPHDTGLDLEQLQEISAYFVEVRKKYHQYESAFTGVDTRVQVNQVPGGMISNLADQLKNLNALERMNEVLAEIPRVREDLGYPPLVTPTSQIVGSQAVLNVLNGKRYQTMTNEVKRYLQGGYGQSPAPVNSLIQRQAIGNEEVITCRPADLIQHEMEKLTNEIGDLAECEEDVLSFAMFPEIGRKFLEQRKAGELVPELLAPPQHGGCMDRAPAEFVISLHGETYQIRVNGSGRRQERERLVYLTVDGMPEEVLVEVISDISLDPAPASDAPAAARPKASHPGMINAAMTCTVVDIKVQVGDRVEQGQPVLITEAMKMETEVAAPIAGTVAGIFVNKGDKVEAKTALLEITAEE